MAGEVSMKVWGKTWSLFSKNNVEIHRIEVRPGGFCSKHRHTSKHNMFIVEAGRLLVDIWREGMDEPDSGELRAGDQLVVPPGVYHRFKALTDVEAYEVYWVELDAGDIDRENHGGMDHDLAG